MDRRVRKTKTILKKSLIDLMQEKDYRKITVTELAEKADVSRSTFYLHYLDIYDLVEELENEGLEQIKKIINKYSNPIDYHRILINVMNYIKRERRFFQSILGTNGNISYINKLKEEMKKIFIKINIDNAKMDQDFKNAFASFIISGGIGVFQEWLDHDCKPTMEHLIFKFYDLFKDIPI